MSTYNLGVVAPVPKGDYDSTADYKVLNIVKHGGSVYMAKQDVEAGTFEPSVTSGWESYWMLLFNEPHPVGSIYETTTLTTATAVGQALGGTWEVFGAGEVLVGVDSTQTEFNAIGIHGGTKTVTLTVNQIPAHTHGYLASSTAGQGSSSGNGVVDTSVNSGNLDYTERAGNNEAHNNLPPYTTVYRYRRIA